MKLKTYFDKAVRKYYMETKSLEFLPKNRYNLEIFPTIGQYDWFSGQLLYCLIRYLKPNQIVEVSTSSGYSTMFMAMALKKNRYGKIDTFEMDSKAFHAAMKNIRRFEVDGFMSPHLGDARIEVEKVSQIKNSDILFLDSLHGAQFAKWFIEKLVMKAPDASLFHMHDILPLHARVRRSGGPPWGILNKKTYRDLLWRIKNFFDGTGAQVERVDLNISLPRKRRELCVYDGNESTEAILGNNLVSKMKDGDYFFCYDFKEKYKDILDVNKYDKFVINDEDEFGKPSEWNASLWAKVGSLKTAYKKLVK